MGLGMKLLSKEEVHAHSVQDLGLDPSSLDLFSVEGIAASLRRAAAFLCPCSARTLTRAAIEPIEELASDSNQLRETVEETLQKLVGYGDLLEHREFEPQIGTEPSSLLYAAPASFVARKSGAAILLGIVPEISTMPEEIAGRIQYVNHVRRIPPNAAFDVHMSLRQLGLIELSYEGWTKAPRPESFQQLLNRFNERLSEAPPSGETLGLILLDSSKPVRYYRGRWVETKSQTGQFVARRPQAYGADLWCYVEMSNGEPIKFVDLPCGPSRVRGCDEAWRIQLAKDAQHGNPQVFRVRSGPGASRIIDFFSPVPMWAQRRWDALGEPIPSAGCLFSYRFSEEEVAEEINFASEMLWLAEARN
jgi:hypothetical protein